MKNKQTNKQTNKQMKQINKQTPTYKLVCKSYKNAFEKCKFSNFKSSEFFLSITAASSIKRAIELGYIKKITRGVYHFTKEINDTVIDEIYLANLDAARIRTLEKIRERKGLSPITQNQYNYRSIDFTLDKCIEIIKAAGGKVMMPTTEFKEV